MTDPGPLEEWMERKLKEHGPAGFPTFDGEPEPAEGENRKRLSKQLLRVWALMRDNQWRTLKEISFSCQCSENSASARLRDFRKVRVMGGNVCHVPRRKKLPGVYEYKVHLVGGCDVCKEEE